MAFSADLLGPGNQPIFYVSWTGRAVLYHERAREVDLPLKIQWLLWNCQSAQSHMFSSLHSSRLFHCLAFLSPFVATQCTISLRGENRTPVVNLWGFILCFLIKPNQKPYWQNQLCLIFKNTNYSVKGKKKSDLANENSTWSGVGQSLISRFMSWKQVTL